MKILYDGWPLAYRPDSPAAIHLLTLLEAHPPGMAAQVALPAQPLHSIPVGVESLVSAAADTEGGRLRWEQRLLPELARANQADLIHTAGNRLALFGHVRAVASPAGFEAGELLAGNPDSLSGARSSLTARIGEALAQGGRSRAKALLWPRDLPAPNSVPSLRRLPPVVHPLFRPVQEDAAPPAALELGQLEAPETFILYHGPTNEAALRRLLDAWSWAAASVGNDYPLLLAGCNPADQEQLALLLAEYQLTGTARPLPVVSLPALAELYRRCTALFHPLEVSVWGDPVRLALACGRPVVGIESERSAALVGPAAYLARPGDSYAAGRRALGGALLTVIVEEPVAEALALAGLERAQAWGSEAFRVALGELYRSLIGVF